MPRVIGRQMNRRLLAVALLVAAISTIGPSLALAGAPVAPTTLAASNVTSTSAKLNGHVFPDASVTTYYYFQYGTTTAYGTQTPTEGPVNGTDKDVSTDVTGLVPNTTYHFRVAATNTDGTSYGGDMTFTTPATTGPPAQNTITIAAAPTTVTFTRATTISGQISGAGNGGVQVTLEENPYPFTGGFKPTTVTATSNATGGYTFSAVPSMNTRYRVTAKTSPPVTSAEVLVNVRPKISLRLSDRTPKVGQRVKFSGTVLPAHDGKVVQIQRRTSSGGWRTVARATLVATTPVNGVARSKYSKRIRIRRNGTYRTRLAPADGDHVTGYSARRGARVHR
jgi:hypothetical protein